MEPINEEVIANEEVVETPAEEVATDAPAEETVATPAEEELEEEETI